MKLIQWSLLTALRSHKTYVVEADDVDGERGIGGDATTTDLLTDGTRDSDNDNVEKAFPIDIPAGEDRPLKSNFEMLTFEIRHS